jgi:hypothetical protein
VYSMSNGDACHQPQHAERVSGEREQWTDDSVMDLRCTLPHVTGRRGACVVRICVRLAGVG